VQATQVEQFTCLKEILEARQMDQYWLSISNALKTGQDYPDLQCYTIEYQVVTFEGAYIFQAAMLSS